MKSLFSEFLLKSILIGIICLANVHSDHVVTLDDQVKDLNDDWMDVTCAYLEIDMGTDPLAFGCKSAKVSSESVGAWTPCDMTSCEFRYANGWWLGPLMKVTIRGYIEGDSSIRVSRKLLVGGNATEEEDVFATFQASPGESPSWKEYTLDMTHWNVTVFSFYANMSIHNTRNNVMIDKILLYYGDAPSKGDPSGSTSILASGTIMSAIIIVKLLHWML